MQKVVKGGLSYALLWTSEQPAHATPVAACVPNAKYVPPPQIFLYERVCT